MIRAIRIGLIASLVLGIQAPGFSDAVSKLKPLMTESAAVVKAAADSQEKPESTQGSAAEIVDVDIERIEKSPTVRYRTHSNTVGWSESGWTVGTLVVAKQDTFAIRTRTGLRQVPLGSIREFAVSAGRYKNTDTGIKFGLIVGGAILVPVAILDASGKSGLLPSRGNYTEGGSACFVTHFYWFDTRWRRDEIAQMERSGTASSAGTVRRTCTERRSARGAIV